jgi:hypothetical protein
VAFFTALRRQCNKASAMSSDNQCVQNREHGFRNPVGLLISSVPKYFEGQNPFLNEFRERRREEKRAARRYYLESLNSDDAGERTAAEAYLAANPEDD